MPGTIAMIRIYKIKLKILNQKEFLKITKSYSFGSKDQTHNRIDDQQSPGSYQSRIPLSYLDIRVLDP